MAVIAPKPDVALVYPNNGWPTPEMTRLLNKFTGSLQTQIDAIAQAQADSAEAIAGVVELSGSLDGKQDRSVALDALTELGTDGFVRKSGYALTASAIVNADLSSADTGGLAEGANLYFTNARADARMATRIPTPQDYSAAGDGATDDTTPVANAITAEDELRLTSDYLVTALTNDYGVALRGPGRILKAITGGNQQLNTDADDFQRVFGQEYLYAFHSKLLAGTSASMLFSGDSTTAGDSASSPYFIDEVVLAQGQARGHRLTATNAGHSGKTTEEWRTLYLSGDLATNPDLYVVRWGINDPFYGRTLADFTTSLRTGLATIRASKTVADMSILLMVPNSTSDTPNGRDEKWYEQVRRVVRQAARDYQCACIDTYAIWQDSRVSAGLWQDDPYADGRAIHPKNVMNTWIGSVMSRLLFPRALDPSTQGSYTPTYTNVSNVASYTATPVQWFRVGNNVTVYGRVDIACTAAGNTLTRLGMSLPVASALTSSTQLAGSGGIGQTTYQQFLCLGDATNDRATLQFLSNGTASAAAFFQYSYAVL